MFWISKYKGLHRNSQALKPFLKHTFRILACFPLTPLEAQAFSGTQTAASVSFRRNIRCHSERLASDIFLGLFCAKNFDNHNFRNVYFATSYFNPAKPHTPLLPAQPYRSRSYNKPVGA